MSCVTIAAVVPVTFPFASADMEERACAARTSEVTEATLIFKADGQIHIGTTCTLQPMVDGYWYTGPLDVSTVTVEAVGTVDGLTQSQYVTTEGDFVFQWRNNYMPGATTQLGGVTEVAVTVRRNSDGQVLATNPLYVRFDLSATGNTGGIDGI